MKRLFELHTPFHLEFKRAREAMQFSPSQSRLGLQTAEQQEAVRIT